jgi:PKD repeat protein
MSFQKLFLAGVFSLSTLSVLAQQEEEEGAISPCGSSEAIQKSLEENPALRLQYEDLEHFTRMYQSGNVDKLLDSTITIPVVFHVIHTYGAERISEAQIRDCIRIINEDFQNRNADSNSVSTPFRNLVGRPQIRFRLAQKDPQGRCTKGINYLENGIHTQGGENLKSLINWNTRRYLNIWVCSNIASGAAAYAYYPGTAPGINNEGIVSRSDYVGSIGSSSPGYKARTLTHEIGHYFNLPHTWGNSNEPGLASNCNIDDGVSDTPLCRGVTGSGCPINQNSCGFLDNVENHMEYSSCRRMFTKGQVLRMHAAVNSSFGGRNQLWPGTNLVFTGTTNDGLGDECPAKVDFKSNVTRSCANTPIVFTQLAYNVNNPAGLSFAWSFPGGDPATSTAANPTVTYATAGTYSVKLVVTNAAGKDSLTRTNLIKILPTLPVYNAGEIESFETTTFPVFPSNPDKNWDISSTITNTWKRSTSASVTGTACLNITNPASSAGAVHTLISPVFRIEGPVANAKVIMKYAFARRQTTNTDKLVVSYSTNCGKTWTQMLNRNAATLQTTTDVIPSTFIPTASDWKQVSMNLLFMQDAFPEFRMRFEFTSGGGNNLYIDDIQLTTITPVSNLRDDQLALNVVPNPSSELPVLQIHFGDQGSQDAQLEIVDVMGRDVVYQGSLLLNPGQNALDLNTTMRKPKAGTYWVRLRLNNRVMVRQWVVLP